MKVLETLWQLMVIVVVSGVSLLAIGLSFSWLETRARDSAQASTVIDARADFERCNTSYPIRVVIINRGDKTLTHVGYSVRIVEPNTDVNLSPASLKYLSYGEDMPPNHAGQICHPAGNDYGSGSEFQLREGLLVSGVVDYVSIR